MNITARWMDNLSQRSLAAIAIICGILLVFLLPNQCDADTTGEWVFGSSLREARYRHTATLLADGRVLIVGGQDANRDAMASVEIFDPVNGTWLSAPPLRVARTSHTATLLEDSRVLVAGGQAGGDAISSVEIYDPDANSWRQAATLHIARSEHSATRLTDGRVLVAGGRLERTDIANAEIYDPTFDAWSTIDSMATARRRQVAVLLPTNGHILVTGGTNDSGSLNNTEKYVPETGSWVQLAPLQSARGFHTANILPSGEVIVTGGLPPDYPDSALNNQATVESYDPGTDRWSFRRPMVYARHLHRAIVLPNGHLLVSGGTGTDNSGSGALNSVDLFDNALNIWTVAPSLLVRRQEHTATLLLDGRVLVVGGRGVDVAAMKSVELYIEPVECYRLTISVIGNGTLSVDPSHSSECGSGYDAARSVVALTANPSSGWQVARWEGTNNDSSTSTSNSITMPARNHEVSVTFEQRSGIFRNYFPVTGYHLPPPKPFPQLLNGYFDETDISAWTQNTSSPDGRHDLIVNESNSGGVAADSPPNLAWLGGTHKGGTDDLSQQIFLPSEYPNVQLSFNYQIRSKEDSNSCQDDIFRLRIYLVDTDSYQILLSKNMCKDSQAEYWQREVVSLGEFAGRQIRIHFIAALDSDNKESSFFLDSVKLCDNSSQHPCN